MRDDSWTRYRVGAVVPVEVVEVRSFGVMVELETGIRGLIHYTEMHGPLSVGQKLEARILLIDPDDEKKIGLSAVRV